MFSSGRNSLSLGQKMRTSVLHLEKSNRLVHFKTLYTSSNATYPAIGNVCLTRNINNSFKNGCYNNSSSCCLYGLPVQKSYDQITQKFPTKSTSLRLYSSKTDETVKKGDENENVTPPVKLSIFQRYKKMMKEYWYVLIPVHIVTSTVWLGSFFYASKCGFDIVPYLEYFNASEKIIYPFRNSSLGHIAVAYLLYKIATPARYTVTLGGTTITIQFLTKRGLIKPMPSKENFKAMVKQKKDEYIQRKQQ